MNDEWIVEKFMAGLILLFLIIIIASTLLK